MSTKIENQEKMDGHFNRDWDANRKAWRLTLRDCSEMFVRFFTRIDGTERTVCFSSVGEKIDDVHFAYGDCLTYTDELLRQLWSGGFSLSDDDNKILRAFLHAKRADREHEEYYHTQKGIVRVVGEDYILGEKNYTKVNTDEAFGRSVYKPEKDQTRLIVKGGKAALLHGLKEYVLGKYIALELAFILGAYGIFSKILHEKDIPNFILSLVGEQHTGKTTTAMLAAAVWTQPKSITKELATEAALQKFLTQDGILPLVANDVTVKCKKLDETIAAFANGKGVERYHSKSLHHFHPLLLTSNKSILGILHESEYTGAVSRMFEFNCPQYTDNAQHARDVKDWLAECHGEAGEMLLEHLASLSDLKAEVSATYSKWLSCVEENHGNVNGRQVESIALMLTAGQFMSEALGVEFRLDKICEELTTVSSKPQNPTALAVYTEVMQLYADNPDKFHQYNGKYDGFDSVRHIGFVREGIIYIRNESITACSFTGRSNPYVKAWLVSNGMLIKGNRGFTHRISKIKGNDNTFYAFKMTV